MDKHFRQLPKIVWTIQGKQRKPDRNLRKNNARTNNPETKQEFAGIQMKNDLSKLKRKSCTLPTFEDGKEFYYLFHGCHKVVDDAPVSLKPNFCETTVYLKHPILEMKVFPRLSWYPTPPRQARKPQVFARGGIKIYIEVGGWNMWNLNADF